MDLLWETSTRRPVILRGIRAIIAYRCSGIPMAPRLIHMKRLNQSQGGKCLLCRGTTENLIHLLFVCPHLHALRTKFRIHQTENGILYFDRAEHFVFLAFLFGSTPSMWFQAARDTGVNIRAAHTHLQHLSPDRRPVVSPNSALAPSAPDVSADTRGAAIAAGPELSCGWDVARLTRYIPDLAKDSLSAASMDGADITSDIHILLDRYAIFFPVLLDSRKRVLAKPNL